MLSRHPTTASAVLLFVAVAVSWASAAEFQCVRNTVDYQSSGRRLDGHVVATYDNVYTVTQCARRCQLLGACASYNFRSAARRCELNSASHVTHPNDVVNNEESLYYLRDAITCDAVWRHFFTVCVPLIVFACVFLVYCCLFVCIYYLNVYFSVFQRL